MWARMVDEARGRPRERSAAAPSDDQSALSKSTTQLPAAPAVQKTQRISEASLPKVETQVSSTLDHPSVVPSASKPLVSASSVSVPRSPAPPAGTATHTSLAPSSVPSLQAAVTVSGGRPPGRDPKASKSNPVIPSVVPSSQSTTDNGGLTMRPDRAVKHGIEIRRSTNKQSSGHVIEKSFNSNHASPSKRESFASQPLANKISVSR